MGTTATSGVSSIARTAVLASADASFRQRVRDALADLRWQVREAEGGAETLACLDASPAEAVVLDSWLPDLEIHEFVAEFKRVHPDVDLIMADASITAGTEYRGPRRNEVLHALRRAQATDGAIWSTAPGGALARTPKTTGAWAEAPAPLSPKRNSAPPTPSGPAPAAASPTTGNFPASERALPEFVGSHPAILEVSRRIRLVAARTTPVLIEGPTGSGKELVARAVHRLSRPIRAQAGRSELRGHSRRPARSRAVRPHARRLHRRGGRPHGTH